MPAAATRCSPPRYGWKRKNEAHGSAAIFGHFRNARRLEGKLEGNISIFWFEHGWFWFIPLADGTTSVGAVCWPYYLKSRDKPLREFFDDTIALAPALQDRLRDATLIDDMVYATGNYSYASAQACGERHALIGDAFAFIDPVFSSGVYFAMRSAFGAAELVATELDHPQRAPAARRTYAALANKGPKEFSWFIYRMTNPTMRGLFMHPKNPLRVKEALLTVLAGDVHRGFADVALAVRIQGDLLPELAARRARSVARLARAPPQRGRRSGRPRGRTCLWKASRSWREARWLLLAVALALAASCACRPAAVGGRRGRRRAAPAALPRLRPEPHLGAAGAVFRLPRRLPARRPRRRARACCSMPTGSTSTSAWPPPRRRAARTTAPAKACPTWRRRSRSAPTSTTRCRAATPGSCRRALPVRAAFTLESGPDMIGWMATPNLNLDLRVHGWNVGAADRAGVRHAAHQRLLLRRGARVRHRRRGRRTGRPAAMPAGDC